MITLKSRYSAPAFNIILPTEHINFGPKKHFHSYLYVGNNQNLHIKHSFDQSRYSWVSLYLILTHGYALMNVPMFSFHDAIFR